MLDCEAILSTGIVTVFFADDGAAQRCAAALNGGNFDGRRIGARYCAGGASRAAANGTSSAPGADEAEAADAASVGDATPPEAELGDTTGDEGESGDDGPWSSLGPSLTLKQIRNCHMAAYPYSRLEATKGPSEALGGFLGSSWRASWGF